MSPHRRSRTDDFIVQGSILAGAAMLTKIIGALYRIPLTRILGDFGMGVYSSAFEIYALALIFSSFAYPIAVSKLVSTRIARGQRQNAHRVFIFSLIFSVVVGLLSASLIFFNADFIASTLFTSPLSSHAIRILAPGLFVVSIMGVFRGYFQGMGTMIPTAASQVIEQIFNAVVSIIGAIVLIGVGVRVADEIRDTSGTYPLTYGAAGATLGTVAGAIVGLLFLLLAYLLYGKSLKKQLRTDRTKKREDYNRIGTLFMITIMPIMFTTAAYNINNLLDISLFTNVMHVQGYDTYTYTSLLGTYTGRYLILINIPLAMANGLAASVIPTLTAAVVEKNNKTIRNRIGQTLQLTTLIAIPCFVAYVVLALPLMTVVFGEPSPLASNLLMIGAVTVVMYSLATVTNSILQGLDRIYIPARNAVIALVIHIITVLIMLIVLRWGIHSLVASNIVFAFVMCSLNIRAIKKHSGYKQDVERLYIKPLIAAIVMGMVAYVTYFLVDFVIDSIALQMVIVIPIAVVVYLFLVIKIGTLTRESMSQLPLGARLYKIARATRALPRNFD